MTYLYDAKGLFPVLRQKNDRILNTKCRKVDLYGGIGCTELRKYFSQSDAQYSVSFSLEKKPE